MCVCSFHSFCLPVGIRPYLSLLRRSVHFFVNWAKLPKFFIFWQILCHFNRTWSLFAVQSISEFLLRPWHVFIEMWEVYWQQYSACSLYTTCFAVNATRVSLSLLWIGRIMWRIMGWWVYSKSLRVSASVCVCSGTYLVHDDCPLIDRSRQQQPACTLCLLTEHWAAQGIKCIQEDEWLWMTQWISMPNLMAINSTVFEAFDLKPYRSACR